MERQWLEKDAVGEMGQRVWGKAVGEGREPVRSLGWAGWREAVKRLQQLAGSAE